MKIIRFVLPFLFVRNWQSGAWELSSARLLIFGALLLLSLFGTLIAYMLHTPVVYLAPSV